ncbi:Glu/Leu/Phe/Val dehydrogenase dimerization domain-containing protein [Motiliproteus sp. MSK22-1]|uniref:Glu/Leu/Phe/Val dehydrogenase dimerization domain-containing protein n=1 Tax=Motiliproteus sp. MSK22-1 TaxID=1897630 RepID=UPI0009772212|nr:Glu/Leu/Phe/Val dehydrogenase dimerization domain-containing protein [Motiliproteus sp. MSK22-1]OMH33760.1 amino acid dehydrogenase [Motiliproteus sp. MSK22-1]
MSVFSHTEFSEHQQVSFFSDRESGLKAIVAIHNTNRGPALGGCRMWPYASDEEALRDVLRLSKGMTYKSALANLNLGGGKSVIIGDPRKDKSEKLLRAMGRFLNQLGGAYIAAEDSGTGVDDLRVMGQETDYVAGVNDRIGVDGLVKNGDPSPSTAYGTFMGVRAAVKHQLGRSDLEGLKVAVQGVGNVGYRLAEHLHQSGAKLYVNDIHQAQVDRAVAELGATAVSAKEIVGLDVDVFAPCALGAVINDNSIGQLKAKVVAGAANNQLSEERHGELLKQKGVLYAPDFVINAGGIIDIGLERDGAKPADIQRQLEEIGDTLSEIFIRADRGGLSTSVIANQIAEERFAHNR